ncbi:MULTISPECIES: ATP-binding protein [Thermodesulfovibrio]|uniref:ATP-binding protein n=1 Tax=Thermodesulfovibrio yellowstonii TaxID=28262 RepID=UPI000420BF9C|nr:MULTISPECIES: ATP-binding protein [Thermodesulfovibrio]MDI6865262.1 ATP-binding protein [Thermodesulfovibrio yellowstonii]
MNTQIFDDLFNFLRVSFLLFHSIVFYYLIFWRKIIEPNFNKRVVGYFFIIIFLHTILNSIILFKNFTGGYYLYLIAANIAVIAAILFYAYKTIINLKLYYLLLAIIFVILFIFKQDKTLIFLGLFLIGISYFHIWYKEEFSQYKPSRVIPSLIKKGALLPFIFFGLYIICLSCYIVSQSLFLNIFATFLVFLSLSFRTRSLYEERFKAYVLYIFMFVLIFSILICLSGKYIEDMKDMDAYHKKLNMQRISLEVKNKIAFYSDLVKFEASSEELKKRIKKGQEELNKYLSYLNQIFDTDLVWFIDKNGNIIACSTEYRKEMINQNVSFRKYFKDSIQGKLSIFIARGIYTKRDDIRISYPVYDRGNIIGVLVLQFDISKNFKKEIDIENAFMMHSSGGILIGKQELKNRMLFSVSPEELKKVYEEKIFGNDRLLPAGFKKIDNDIFEDFKGRRWQIVKYEITNDWWLASFLNLSLYEKFKGISYIVLIIFAFISHSFAIRSLDRLRNIFLNLAEEVEEKRTAFDSVDTGFIYTDSSGNIKYMNKEARRLLDVSDDSFGKQLNELLTFKEHNGSEYKILQIKEKEVPVIYTENPILVKGIKFGDVITIKDATEIIQRQELSKRLERMDILTKISAGIVHDFSNYLMVLTGNLSLLKELEKSEDKKENIEIMLEVTKIMNTIIEQMKDLSPDFILKKEKLNVEDIVKSSTEFVLNGTAIEFTIESEPSILPVYADAAQLYRVFQNIIMNSRQAMEDKGNIKIKIQNYINDGELEDLKKGNYVCLTITDSGPGIPKEYIDKIFDPFFTMKKEGKGLGLSIVKNVIEKSGGKIEVESISEIGTTFRIYIPASDKI